MDALCNTLSSVFLYTSVGVGSSAGGLEGLSTTVFEVLAY